LPAARWDGNTTAFGNLQTQSDNTKCVSSVNYSTQPAIAALLLLLV
jgi:hypothetical protein